jgi:hypothetical protein
MNPQCCKYCGSTKDLVRFLSLTINEQRCPNCLNQLGISAEKRRHTTK